MPFKAATIDEIERAHKTAAVPALGGKVPVALDGVIAKAMAKRPADRFASVLDLAAAVRTAAGLGDAAAQLPSLDEGLRDALLADAPHPVAEAVAALGAARNVHQARDAVIDIVRASVRYIGVVAIACRTRVGAGGSGDGARVIELLQTLRRRGLADGEWIELARELTSPFVGRRDVYPVPELVDVLHDGAITKALDEMIAGQVAERHGAPEEQVREALERALPALSAVLRGFAFFAEYTIVVPHGQGQGDQWMGTARTRRTVIAVSGEVVDGRPLLVDAEGRPVLMLWPLVQVAPPTPGAVEDLFVLAGKGRHGARLVSLPAGFERYDEQLWEWFRSELGIGDSADAAATEAQAPYRGLAAFTPADAGMFFGREREAEAFLNRLRVAPLLAVVGASGAGKSSFVQAGVVPDLPAGWKTLTVRPGPTPIATLVAQLATWGIDGAGLASAIATDPRVLGERLRAAGAKLGATLLLIVDQFEEIFTLCSDRDERRAYAAAVAVAARSAEPVRVILTMRDDFLLRAEQLPSLRDRLGHGLELLAMPAPEDLKRILVEPARRHGFEFEDAAMPDEMVAQIADQPGALPLLAFAAAKLWEVRDRQFRKLPRKAYDAMGGVGGALAQHAESTLASLPPDELFLVREAFRHLVTSEGTRAVLSRDELVQVLGEPTRAEHVVEKMVGSRLLVAQEGEDGGKEHIEVVHEALIRAWPRLVAWRQEDAEGARLRDQLRSAARQWEAKNRPRGHLWRDEQLTEYQLWRSRYRGRLTDLEEEFAGAALAEAARGRRIRRIVLVASAVIAALVIVGLVWMNDRTQGQRSRAEAANQRAETALAEARARMIGLYQELGRQELLAEQQLRALVYLAAAYARGGEGPALAAMIANAARPVDAERHRLQGHTDWVVATAWSGDQLVTGGKDGTLRWWKAGAETRRVDAHPGGVIAIDVNKRLATAGPSDVKIWEGSRLVETIVQSGVRNVVWNADGTRLAFVTNTGNFFVHDAAGKLVTSGTQSGTLNEVAFSIDPKRMATAGKRGELAFHDVSGATASVAVAHGAEILALAYSPDGKRVATAGVDGKTVLWDAIARTRLLVLGGHTLRVNHVTWSADGTRVLTSSKDSTARVWDARDGRQLLLLAGHTEEVNLSWFSPDGSTIVTASDDRTSRTWDARTGVPLMTFEGHTGGVMAAAFSADGARLATSSYDKTARVWDARAGARRAVFVEKAEIFDGAFLDAERVVLGGTRGRAAIWNPRTGAHSKLAISAPLDGHDDLDVKMNRVAPGRALTVATDGTADVWDADGKRLAAVSMIRSLGKFAAATWAGDGKLFALGDYRGAVDVFRADGSPVASLPSRDVPITALAFDHDAKRLAIAAVDGATIHELGGSRSITLSGHTGAVASIAWSLDDTTVVTTSADRTARIWKSDGTLLHALIGHTNSVLHAAFSPDGKRLVTSSWDRTAKLWDVATGKLVASLDRHTEWVMQAAFTPDGGRVITASHDWTAMVWDVAGGRLIATLGAHRDEANTIAISADGTRALTTSQDGTAMLWDVTADRRTRAEIERLVTCRVPYKLDGEKLIPVEPRCE